MGSLNGLLQFLVENIALAGEQGKPILISDWPGKQRVLACMLLPNDILLPSMNSNNNLRRARSWRDSREC